MLQPMKSRRSCLAVLTAVALVASVLAAGAAPAGAETDRADHTTPLSACVGDAAADQSFSDVPAGHAFRNAINCIAYYGITLGTGDGSTYSPERDVTRAQMAVFIARAAEVAGVDLGPVGDAGFDDIAGTWGEAQDAINRLASKGIIPSGGAYRPGDAVTRAEMATFLIGLLIEAAPNVTRDSSGTILLGPAGSRSVADDRFPDTADPEIAAIYELGVTRGASAAAVQDATMPPLDLNYEPGGTVDRGQMAAFITRALAHTPVRPTGVTAQFDGADVVVSVRDAQYRPVPGAVVDVFWTVADQQDRAVPPGGTCRASAVTQADPSSFPCEIDGTDPVTGRDGDARVAVTGLRRVPAGGATVWAWTGRDGDTVAAGTELFMFDVAEGADIGYATTTLVTTPFNARKVRFGGSVVYTLQLQDLIGNVPTGVNGVDRAQWQLSVQVDGQDPDMDPLVSSSTGRASFSISVDDPNPRTDDADVTVTYRLTAADNAPSAAATVLANGDPAATGTLTFSDDAASIASGSATVTIDARDYVYLSGGSTGVTVTVLDQYGLPFPGARVSLNNGAEATVNSSGSHRFSHQYSGPATGQTDTLTARYGETSASIVGATAQLHWVADAGPSDDGTARAVLTGDVRRREIVVNDGTGPVLLVYDGNDRFNLEGDPTSMAGFEAALAAALRLATPGVELEWSNYLANSDSRVTEYDLSAS